MKNGGKRHVQRLEGTHTNFSNQFLAAPAYKRFSFSGYVLNEAPLQMAKGNDSSTQIRFSVCYYTSHHPVKRISPCISVHDVTFTERGMRHPVFNALYAEKKR